MKQIPNYPMYFADESGSVWTTKRKGGNDRTPGKSGPPRRLSVHKNKDGYCFVNFDICGKTISRSVHQLILETFVGPKPDGQEGCHYPDHNKSNNRLDNLRWDTRVENIKDNYRQRGPVLEKSCRKCKHTKPAAEFYRERRASDGLKTECKSCHLATAVASRDPEKRRRANREYMRRIRSK